jgi:rRNA maturation RNase YbeY
MKNSNVYFFYQEVSFAFRNRNKLKSFLVKLFKKEGFVLKQLNVIFCTDKALLEMNRRFLKHDYFTDIITFPLSEKSKPIEAELYISIDRIKENARTNNQSFKQELHRVIFHGCLHLLGFNDKSSQQIKIIRERESHYLRLYFLK